MDPDLIFPISDQQQLTEQVNGYLAEGSHITFLTFDGVDHMGSARKFFYIKAARDWLFDQVKAWLCIDHLLLLQSTLYLINGERRAYQLPY